MSPTTTHRLSTTTSARRLRRLAAVVTAVVTALALWAIAVHAAGVDLRSPGFGQSQKPAALSPGAVAAVSGLAGFTAWGLLALLERTTRRPLRVWTTVALLALVVSLGAPLSGQGVSAASRGILACLHVLAAVTIIVLIGRTARGGRGVSGWSQQPPVPTIGSADATPQTTGRRA
ncbi:MAG: DUF6069 family protein [Mycobacteriales bacterium]